MNAPAALQAQANPLACYKPAGEIGNFLHTLDKKAIKAQLYFHTRVEVISS